MSVDIGKYFPQIYQEIPEIQEIISTENADLTNAENELRACINNQFIMTADERTISYLEKKFNIIANPSIETLDFRRLRLINRVSTQPPFTTIFLRQKLDGIIGEGEYNLTIDYPNYTIFIESVAKNQVYSHEILVTLNMIKPANMAYVNVPTILTPILVNESISKANLQWNYKLGTTWILGKLPFLSYTNEEVIKLASIPSVQQYLLNKVSEYIDNSIASVTINDELTIPVDDFTSIETTEDGKLIFSYEVTPESGITVINTVSVNNLDENGETQHLLYSNIYVPVSETVIMKHTIQIREG